MSIYKVYIINNEEHFEIWNDSLTVLITSYSTTFTYTLCDYASLSKKDIEHSSEIIKKIIYEKKNKKALLSELVDISKIYLFLQDQEQHILKSWKKYPDDIANVLIQEYEYISLFFTQAVNNKTISNIFLECTLTVKIENINGRMCEVLYPKHTKDVIYYLLCEMAKRDILFKICRRCKRVFPCFEHKNTCYCERTVSGINKTCSQLKNQKIVEDKAIADDDIRKSVMAVFEKAYKRQRGRVDYGSKTKKQFKVWSKKARHQRDLCLAMQIPISEFEEWIIKNDWNYEDNE